MDGIDLLDFVEPDGLGFAQGLHRRFALPAELRAAPPSTRVELDPLDPTLHRHIIDREVVRGPGLETCAAPFAKPRLGVARFEMKQRRALLLLLLRSCGGAW